MKKRFLILFVIAVFISLFASSTIFAQSPPGIPVPGTMEYLEWFLATQGHPDNSIFNVTGTGSFNVTLSLDATTPPPPPEEEDPPPPPNGNGQ